LPHHRGSCLNPVKQGGCRGHFVAPGFGATGTVSSEESEIPGRTRR
jgi:hypothetical protein